MKPYESNSVERWSLDHYTERQIILYSKEKRERERRDLKLPVNSTGIKTGIETVTSVD